MKIKVVSTSWNILASITDRRLVWSQPAWPRLQSTMKSAALTVQSRSYWTGWSLELCWAFCHSGIQMPVPRKQEPIHIRGCCPAWAEIMSWQTEMHRLKQTLWLIEDSKREGEKIKSKALLTRLINEIILCFLGGEARRMAQRASTDETVDLSGNKEPSHWGASGKGSRKAWPHCAFERTWV